MWGNQICSDRKLRHLAIEREGGRSGKKKLQGARKAKQAM